MRREAERLAGSCCHNPGEGEGGPDQCLAVEVERSDVIDLNQPGA